MKNETRRILILSVLAFCCLCAGKADNPKIRKILDAIRQVESSGGRDKRDGDDGKAIGPYQIWEVYWEDSNQPGSWEDCRNKEYAERVILAYWKRYCKKALENYDYEAMARTHKGGPEGRYKPETLEYWEKVKRHLN